MDEVQGESKAHRLARDNRLRAEKALAERQADKLRKIAHKKAAQQRKGWPPEKSPI